jgi:hypothetical protein
MTDPDQAFNKHFRTRATGRLYVRPLQAEGYDQRVIEMTINELDFGNSVNAGRFVERQRAKYATPKNMCNNRRLKHISEGDDR